ncbi:hypothetical protein CRP_056 [Candidatus Carsonella ruddii PV]|uniref:Uncharacterized protein n=1 Tax=Carsonella ruddii (strain PV) TaxID=387662 RepID=Q05FT4_CARRP|nr:hypothetical protein [Candidatus Carsonella ruddii]BAF35087.1 hypothetical protein CRP_056 [Candidatus Carsonella ruddii PV]
MNIQNLIKFKKEFGQNYVLFQKKKKIDFCSGFNFFNCLTNDLDYLKSCFCKNKIYIFNNKNFYKNFLIFFFPINYIVNINLPFNIINFFIKKQFKIKNFYFKLIIYFFFITKFKITGIVNKIKFFKINIFYPFTKVKIVNILYKKNVYLKFIYKKIKLNNFKFIKSVKMQFFIFKIINSFNKNVFCNKI